MKKITLITFLTLSSFAGAKSYNHYGEIHVREQGTIAALPANAPIMSQQAAQRRLSPNALPLNFNRRGQAHVAGTIRGLGMAAYRFSGQAGQQVRIVPVGKNYSMVFGLFDRQRGMNFGRTHILPVTGEYEIRIVQSRRNAAWNRKRYRYSANILLGGVVAVPPAPQGNIFSAGEQQSSDGTRYVESTSTPLQGRRSGKISALQVAAPQQIVTHRHIQYSGTPSVVGDPAGNINAASPARNFQCQTGQLAVQFAKLNSNRPQAVVQIGRGRLRLVKNQQESDQRNIIFTGKNKGFLHLVLKAGSDLSNAEVLSFEYKGKTLATGCK